jgi:MSHA biogenesis protein MshM
MYETHFGLRELPFSITPDTSFFFSSDGAQSGLNLLLIAARSGEGFIKIVGEVGTGKTLLCRKLMHCLGDDFRIAYVPNPCLSPRALFLELAWELGVSPDTVDEKSSRHQLIHILQRRLLELAHDQKRVLVCLDEVQAMPTETLEALRLLTNLETEKRKLLQVIIFGQPELEARLDAPSVRQLRQRITFEYRLGPLSDEELDFYVQHRLSVAGHTGGRVFSRAAMRLMRQRTGGYPRLVNIVAHKALMAAYGKGKRQVGYFDMRAACRDTPSTRAVARGSWATLGLLSLAAIVAAAFTWMGMT